MKPLTPKAITALLLITSSCIAIAQKADVAMIKSGQVVLWVDGAAKRLDATKVDNAWQIKPDGEEKSADWDQWFRATGKRAWSEVLDSIDQSKPITGARVLKQVATLTLVPQSPTRVVISESATEAPTSVTFDKKGSVWEPSLNLSKLEQRLITIANISSSNLHTMLDPTSKSPGNEWSAYIEAQLSGRGLPILRFKESGTAVVILRGKPAASGSKPVASTVLPDKAPTGSKSDTNTASILISGVMGVLAGAGAMYLATKSRTEDLYQRRSTPAPRSNENDDRTRTALSLLSAVEPLREHYSSPTAEACVIDLDNRVQKLLNEKESFESTLQDQHKKLQDTEQAFEAYRSSMSSYAESKVAYEQSLQEAKSAADKHIQHAADLSNQIKLVEANAEARIAAAVTAAEDLRKERDIATARNGAVSDIADLARSSQQALLLMQSELNHAPSAAAIGYLLHYSFGKLIEGCAQNKKPLMAAALQNVTTICSRATTNAAGANLAERAQALATKWALPAVGVSSQQHGQVGSFLEILNQLKNQKQVIISPFFIDVDSEGKAIAASVSEL